jgi:hypothetical protein
MPPVKNLALLINIVLCELERTQVFANASSTRVLLIFFFSSDEMLFESM